MKPAFFILFLCLFQANAWGQQDSAHTVTRLQDAFLKGNVHGRFRSVYLTDINDGSLTDYYAVAAGGALKFETAEFHHFTAGIGSSFTYNLSSSDLGAPDPATGQKSRYEILLMDVEDPYNRNHMVRLDGLYLKYRFKSGHISWGKQFVVTPFINHQELFMRGSAVDGIYGNVQATGKLKIEAAYLYGISPNATTRWFHVGESIGFFPKGVNADGKPANYTNNLHSDGLGFIGIHYKPVKKFQLQVWDQYVDQVFNTALLQADYVLSLNRERKLTFAFQSVRQDALANGGNVDPSKAYMAPGAHAWTLGGRVMYQSGGLETSLNYTRITADGRYQMPREWGREPFFTFLMREQIEGAGDVHAFTTRTAYTFKKAHLKADLGIGYYNMPDVRNAAMSKYGMPSFIQYGAILRYSFSGRLKGLDAELVYLYKQRVGEVYNNERYVINKVNMSHICPSLSFSF